jgi:hypothetical protein
MVELDMVRPATKKSGRRAVWPFCKSSSIPKWVHGMTGATTSPSSDEDSSGRILPGCSSGRNSSCRSLAASNRPRSPEAPESPLESPRTVGIPRLDTSRINCSVASSSKGSPGSRLNTAFSVSRSKSLTCDRR